MGRPRAAPGPDSRARLLAAATEEFAARGLTGASVDRIAARARLNKAMVYYHFASKNELYRAALRETFAAVSARIAAIRVTPAVPEERVAAFVAALVEEAGRRPAFPRMILREMSESGRHFDVPTAHAWLAVPESFFALLRDGIDQGVFRPVHPLVAFLATIGPVVLLLASAPARARLGRLTGRPLPDVDSASLTRHAQAIVLAALASGAPSPSHLNGPRGDRHVTPPTPPRPLAGPSTARRRRVP